VTAISSVCPQRVRSRHPGAANISTGEVAREDSAARGCWKRYRIVHARLLLRESAATENRLGVA